MIINSVLPCLISAALLANCSGSSLSPKSESSAPANGVGGSMARFALMGNQLYTVDNATLHVFDVSQAANPVEGEKVKLGFGIETIFPYGDKLFIGSQTGMQIFDASKPAKPEFLSRFAHVVSCDPVVVQGNFAYVTLRGGTRCNRGVNRLDVVDVSNLRQPVQVFSLPMQNPHGLGVDGKTLFVGEGNLGLKVFDLTNPARPAQTRFLTDVKSFDVIPLRQVLLITGEDGLFQYDYADPVKMKLLSKIPVEP
ncbi:MAG: hypothetical protein LH606_10845 [Cytophagaceae bacterium]|nr:hypothetical protein [Cytophagaceae bacterium]